MPLSELELTRMVKGEAEARLSTAKGLVEHHKARLASLPRNADKGQESLVSTAIADAQAMVAVRQRELDEITARAQA